MCADKALTKPAIEKHGSVGWYEIWDPCKKVYAPKEYIYFKPRDEDFGTWKPAIQYYISIAEIREKNK